VAAGLHGANRLGGNSLSDLLVFGKLAGEHAAKFARDKSALAPDPGEVSEATRLALEPFDRPTGENPYAVQHDLQEMMQELVGIVRREDEMVRAREGLGKLRERARRVGAPGNREYNPGWHTALDLDNLLTVSEAVVISAMERKESRGGHFRDDYPDKKKEFAEFNIVVQKAPDGSMQLRREPIVGRTAALDALVEKYK
jgi:succinate dehydrogenase / fumarate reductase flavoprotein subunit